MRKLLLAAGAALALSGSAVAMPYDVAADEGRLVGILTAASQRCDASYDPQGMANLANAILDSLHRYEDRFSAKEITSITDQIAGGMGTFDGTAASLGLKFACDSTAPTVARGRAAFNRYR